FEHLRRGDAVQLEALEPQLADLARQQASDSAGLGPGVVLGEADEIAGVPADVAGDLLVGLLVGGVVDREDDRPVDPGLGRPAASLQGPPSPVVIPFGPGWSAIPGPGRPNGTTTNGRVDLRSHSTAFTATSVDMPAPAMAGAMRNRIIAAVANTTNSANRTSC